MNGSQEASHGLSGDIRATYSVVHQISREEKIIISIGVS